MWLWYDNPDRQKYCVSVFSYQFRHFPDSSNLDQNFGGQIVKNPVWSLIKYRFESWWIRKIDNLDITVHRVSPSQSTTNSVKQWMRSSVNMSVHKYEHSCRLTFPSVFDHSISSNLSSLWLWIKYFDPYFLPLITPLSLWFLPLLSCTYSPLF